MGESMKYLSFKEYKKYICPISTFFIIVLGFYFFLFKRYTPIFGINDDWTVYMVLSGSYLGKPDPYVLFFLYPLAWLLCLLYKITTEIPWYGLLLHGCFILSGFWLFIRCYTRLKTKRLLVAIVALVIFLCSNIRILLAIQYTHSAAVCGAAAIFCFITADTKGADWKQYLWTNIPTVLMAALALSIRQNAAYMCLPVAGMLFLAKWLIEDRKIDLELIKKYSGFLITLFGVLGSLLLIHKIAYSDVLWSEYADINYYREKVVDFYGGLTYEEMKDVADEIGMTEEEYNLREMMLPFYNADMPYSEFLKIMTERSKEKYDLAHPFSDRLEDANKNIVESLTDKNLRPQNLIYGILFVAAIMCFVCNKEWKGILALGFYLFGRFFAWYYVLFNGRFPIRIPQCLYAIDILAVLAILIFFQEARAEKKSFNDTINITLGIILVVITLGTFYSAFNQLEEEMAYIDVYQDRWYGVKEYCMQHPENMYLLNDGSRTLYYYSDNVFDTKTTGKLQNYYSISNFYSMSPNCFKKTNMPPGCNMAEELLNQGNNYWIYEKGQFTGEEEFVKYYRNHYPTFSCELVDTFETETASFEVYFMTK